MKKRLLSAALALAMALTLLPMSVFAAVTVETSGTGKLPSNAATYTNASGQTVYRYNPATNTTVTVSQYLGRDAANGREYGKWYWLDNTSTPQSTHTYYEVTSGIVMGTAQNEVVTSGQWWADLNDFTNPSSLTSTSGKTLRSTNFTILGTDTITMASGTWASNSLQVFFAGAGSFTPPSTVTNLTVNTTNVTTATKGTVVLTGIPDRSGYPAAGTPTPSGFTLNATNVSIGGITLTGRSNSVTLTNCAVGGTISMDGETNTHATDTTVKTHYRQSLTITGGTVTGAITVKGDGSSVSLTSVNAGGTGVALGVTGHGGSVTIAGATVSGKVTVKSRAASSTDTANGNIPTVNVTGGTVAGIAVDTNEKYASSSSFTVSRGTSGPVNITDEISTNKGTVSIANSQVRAVAVNEGTLNLTGPVTANGTITLGASGKTNLGISGTGINLTGITTATTVAGDNLNITSWPTGRENYYGTLSLTGYKKQQINGGTFNCPGAMPFGTAAEKAWFNTTTSKLTYRAFLNGKVALYKDDELARAIQDIGQTAVQTPGNLMPIGQGADATLTLKWGSGSMAKIGFSALTPVILPAEINSHKVATWMWMDSTSNTLIKSFAPNSTVNFPANDTLLVADGTVEDVALVNKITGGYAEPVEGCDIRATVNGNTIVLTGAVPEGLAGLTGITLNLTTDAVNGNGDVVVLSNVPVDFNSQTKETRFGDVWAGNNGAQTKDGKLVLSNGTTYTVNGSGLAVSASDLQLVAATNDGYPIEVSFGGSVSGYNDIAKKELTDALSTNGAGMKIAADCKAWAQAINAAQATITSNQTVGSWRDNARNTIWSRGFKSTNASLNTAVNGYAVNPSTGGYSFVPHAGTYAAASTTDKSGITNQFSTVYIVPYLQVNVTRYDAGSGELEATLVPSFRVEVSADPYNPNMAYVAQAGRALSNLTGEMGSGITVKFNLGNKFASQFLHQDGKYVYAGNSGAWTFTHAGNNGLGSIVINGTNGLITLTQPTGSGAKFDGAKYDSVQAAVDDTVPAKDNSYSTVTIDGGFDKSCAFDMTGVARTIQVVAQGNQTVSCSSNYVDAPQVNGKTYTFQLKKDVVVVNNVDVAVNNANNGSATSSTSKAKAGDQVTITVNPNTGYTGNVTAVTNTGAAVPVVNNGNNTFTFTVPTGATKVTVTPVFNASTGLPFTDVAATDSFFAAVKWNYDNKFIQGTTATTFRPYNYLTRGQIVLILYRNAGSPAVSYTSYPYTDMPTYDAEMCRAIIWATQNKIVNGYGDGRFGPGYNVRNQEMAKILYLFNAYRGKAMGTTSVNLNNYFTDASQISAWAVPYVQWAVGNGVMGATTGKMFQPQLQLQRYQAAVDVYNYGLRFGA